MSERARAGETLRVAPTWQIEENRWSACRHGVAGWAVDPETGVRQRMGDALEHLLAELTPFAERLSSEAGLARAKEMVTANGAMGQREMFRAGGARGVAQDLVARFLEPWAG
jgi:carboxylate-amine ligase